MNWARFRIRTCFFFFFTFIYCATCLSRKYDVKYIWGGGNYSDIYEFINTLCLKCVVRTMSDPQTVSAPMRKDGSWQCSWVRLCKLQGTLLHSVLLYVAVQVLWSGLHYLRWELPAPTRVYSILSYIASDDGQRFSDAMALFIRRTAQ
jgi:hypothetical protein